MAKAPIEIRSLARQHTELAVKTLVSIMTNDKAHHTARVSAAQYILDRGWGKAVQALEVTQVKPFVIRSPSVSQTAQDWSQEHVPDHMTEH